jgi:hypothetical protein
VKKRCAASAAAGEHRPIRGGGKPSAGAIVGIEVTEDPHSAVQKNH